MIRKPTAFIAITLIGVLVMSAPLRFAAAQIPVIDSANLTQNVLAAARLLQQINTALQQLQTELGMLQRMETNLLSLPMSVLTSLQQTLARINGLIAQAQGIAFTVNATQTQFSRFYPMQYPAGTSTTQLYGDALQRWQNAMNAFQTTLTVQAQIAQNVQTDTANLSALVNAAQGAAGNLQIQQTNAQLAGLSAKQLLQIQSLMAAQYRAQALEAARRAESQQQAQSAFTTFLGTANAYAP
jgi:type IV secretion system protein TrbJ